MMMKFLNSLILLAVLGGVSSFKFATGEKQIVQDEKENKSESCEHMFCLCLIYVLLRLLFWSSSALFQFSGQSHQLPMGVYSPWRKSQYSPPLTMAISELALAPVQSVTNQVFYLFLPYPFQSTNAPSTVISACSRNGRIWTRLARWTSSTLSGFSTRSAAISASVARSLRRSLVGRQGDSHQLRDSDRCTYDLHHMFVFLISLMVISSLSLYKTGARCEKGGRGSQDAQPSAHHSHWTQRNGGARNGYLSVGISCLFLIPLPERVVVYLWPNLSRTNHITLRRVERYHGTMQRSVTLPESAGECITISW